MNWTTWTLGGLIALGLAATALAAPKHKPNTKRDVEKTVDSLIRQLRDSDFTVRRGGARGLGRIGAAARRAVPALLEALKDAHPDVRAAAELALNRIAETALKDCPEALCVATAQGRTR